MESLGNDLGAAFVHQRLERPHEQIHLPRRHSFDYHALYCTVEVVATTDNPRYVASRTLAGQSIQNPTSSSTANSSR
jgi:hypothetical protein